MSSCPIGNKHVVSNNDPLFLFNVDKQDISTGRHSFLSLKVITEFETVVSKCDSLFSEVSPMHFFPANPVDGSWPY